MPSKVSGIPRREPHKAGVGATASITQPMQKWRPTPVPLKATTKLPVPSSYPSPTTPSNAPLKNHMHTRSTTIPSTRIPKSPRPRSTPLSPKVNSVTGQGTTYRKEPHGLLTPTSVGERTPGQKSSLSTLLSPTAPKKEDQPTKAPAVVSQLYSPGSAKSPYMHAHVGDACIRGALVHWLICGHKVMTRIPVSCKSNCSRPLPEYVEKFANPKDESHPFVCASCVEEHVQKHRQAKRDILIESISKTMSQMGVTPDGWLDSQLAYWERVWENDMQKERAEFAKLGEDCTYVPRGPESGETTCKAVEESAALPWPPRKRPKQVRGDSAILMVGKEDQ